VLLDAATVCREAEILLRYLLEAGTRHLRQQPPCHPAACFPNAS
jgi:hypothetical protein